MKTEAHFKPNKGHQWKGPHNPILKNHGYQPLNQVLGCFSSTPHSGCNNGRFNSFNWGFACLKTFHVIPVVTGILGWAWTRIIQPPNFFLWGGEKSNKSVKLLLMAEILHQLRLVVYPIIYRVYTLFIHHRWCRISSINSITLCCTWGHEVKKNLQPTAFCKKTHGQRPGNGSINGVISCNPYK